MYKVLPVEGGFDVFRLEPDKEPVLVPHTNKVGKIVPYRFRQAAYRRCKALNDEIKKVDAMIARDGAIIV